MNKKVLVLNADYSALTICSANKAFLLVFLEKAELVLAEKSKKIRTVTKTFSYPSVIRLSRYINVPYKKVILTRENVFRRDGYKCGYCGTNRELTLDHVIPKARGGKTTWTNLVTACKNCNAHKGSKTLSEFEIPLKINPFRPTFLMFIRDYSGKITKKWEPYL